MSSEPVRITAPLLDVLEVFLRDPRAELHGWAIIKASSRGGPTVYKILERLDEMGWVDARWEDRSNEPNKPRRRYYRLTGEGVGRARDILAARRPRAASPTLRPVFGGGHL
jgi:DNA-binding PadR family transcriptional regulator